METTAWVLWNNPWLDWSVAVQTEEREQLRAQLVVDYIVGSVAVALCWIKWWLEGVRAKHRALAKESRGAQK